MENYNFSQNDNDGKYSGSVLPVRSFSTSIFQNKPESIYELHSDSFNDIPYISERKTEQEVLLRKTNASRNREPDEFISPATSIHIEQMMLETEDEWVMRKRPRDVLNTMNGDHRKKRLKLDNEGESLVNKMLRKIYTSPEKMNLDFEDQLFDETLRQVKISSKQSTNSHKIFQDDKAQDYKGNYSTTPERCPEEAIAMEIPDTFNTIGQLRKQKCTEFKDSYTRSSSSLKFKIRCIDLKIAQSGHMFREEMQSTFLESRQHQRESKCIPSEYIGAPPCKRLKIEKRDLS